MFKNFGGNAHLVGTIPVYLFHIQDEQKHVALMKAKSNTPSICSFITFIKSNTDSISIMNINKFINLIDLNMT